MAVTTSYSFGFVSDIDPFSITGNADATSLGSGGVAVAGDHIGHTDATIFGSDGTIGGSAAVLSGTESAIAQLSNGNIVVATDNGNQTSFTILNGTGGVVSGPTPSDVTFNQLLDVDVTALTGGGFVVASQAFFAGTDNDIRINVRSDTGASVTSFSVDTSGANDQNPSVAGLADGGFAVAWHRNVGSNNEMWYAVYNANGSVRQAPVLLDNIGNANRNASVVALDNGGFAIAYEDSGWSGNADIDITLARFTAAGAFVDWDDITQNGSNDTGPSATVLSNGMIAVGYTNDVFGDTDTRITLVDQNTGAALGTSTVGGSLGNEFGASIAAMNNGRLGSFFTLSGDVVGQVRQATRFSTGDAAADTITGDDLRDVVNAGDGSDTIRGGGNADTLNGDGGNDTFTFATGEAGPNESVDGGADNDRILALSSVSFLNATLTSIEEIEFNAGAPVATVQVRANQFGPGLSANLVVDGNATNIADTLRVVMGVDGNVDLSRLTFLDFDTAGTENDRILIVGDNNAEAIVGSDVRDDINSSGGNDVLRGGDGGDVMNAGVGADRFDYNDIADSTLGAAGRDEITLFSQAQGDTIDLSTIDANAGLPGNQAFTFIGGAAFSGPGQVRFVQAGGDTYVYVNVNNAPGTDMAIKINNVVNLTAADFVL